MQDIHEGFVPALEGGRAWRMELEQSSERQTSKFHSRETQHFGVYVQNWLLKRNTQEIKSTTRWTQTRFHPLPVELCLTSTTHSRSNTTEPQCSLTMHDFNPFTVYEPRSTVCVGPRLFSELLGNCVVDWKIPLICNWINIDMSV